jgi:hypothetical protein
MNGVASSNPVFLIFAFARTKSVNTRFAAENTSQTGSFAQPWITAAFWVNSVAAIERPVDFNGVSLSLRMSLYTAVSLASLPTGLL